MGFQGRKIGSSGSQQSSTRAADTLHSTDTVEIILGISEGPILGPVDGAKSWNVGDTPLLDNSGTPNVANFDLKIYKGTNPGESIAPNLGGVGASTEVNQPIIDFGDAVTRSAQHTNIDYVDVRIAVNALYDTSTTTGSTYATGVAFGIEVKRRSAAWANPLVVGSRPSYSDSASLTQVTSGGAASVGRVVNSAEYEVYAQATPPTAKANGAIWFDTSLPNAPPKIGYGTAWQTPANLTGAGVQDFWRWTFLDAQNVLRSAYYSPDGVAPSFPLQLFDFLVTPNAATEQQGTPQSYVWNGSAFIDASSWLTPEVVDPGILSFWGVISTTYVKTYRVKVPRIDEPYDIRVTRQTRKSDQYLRVDFSWESFQEISVDPLQFPDLAVAHLTIQATDTFTSLPDFTCEYYGRVIRVPGNYDPVTRTLDGVWDGVFKFAYTSNPAWIAYDLVMNTRYGMNSYYPVTLDKWDVLEFAKHCDRYGFTYNDYIQDPRNLKEMCDYVVGIAGGRFIDRMDGFATILFDADDQAAIAEFSQDNIVDGIFTYSFTDINERKNDFTVSFINPDLAWQEDRLRIFSQDAIDTYGRNPEDFIAVGCIDEGEAVRRGRLRLATSLLEKTIVNFKTNRMGLYLEPFSVILVADEDMGDGLSGRVKSISSPTQIELRDPIYFEAADTPYQITFQVTNGTDGYELVTYALAPTVGNVTTLRLATPLDRTLPEYAHFTLSQPDRIGFPKPYRITTIQEVEGDPDNVSISAIEVNRQKWAYVNGDVDLRDVIKFQSGNNTGFVLPITDPKIIPQTTLDGHHNLIITWNASQSAGVLGYRIYQSLNNASFSIIGEPKETTFTVYDVEPATYAFTIVAIGFNGQESPPVTIVHSIAGANTIRSVVPASNLRLLDEPVEGIFNSRSPIFAWDASTGPFIARYRVEVVNTTTDVVIRTTNTTDTSFQYTFEMNVADGGPRRSFTVKVYAEDVDGYLSVPLVYHATNPVPAALQLDVSAGFDSIFIKYDKPGDLDFSGVLIWVSEVQGFNPLTTTPVYDGPNTSLVELGSPGTTYYVRGAGYDLFGKTGLNISPEIAVTVVEFGAEVEAPPIPAGLSFTSTISIGQDGTVNTLVTATWTPIVSDVFGYYDFEIKEGTGSYLSYQTATATWTYRGIRPGTVITGKVRAVSKTGYGISGFSPEVSHVVAANLTPPGPVTNIQVAAAFQSVFLSWTNPTNPDLDHVEIWEGTTNSRSAATKIASVAGTAFTRTGLTSGAVRYYWFQTFNTSGTAGPFAPPDTAGILATTAYIQNIDLNQLRIERENLANGIIDATALAASLEAVTVITGNALPTVKTTNYVTFGGQLYQWSGSAYIRAIDAANLSGALSSDQISGLQASKLIGQVVAAQVASVNAAIIAGQLTDAQIRDIDAAKLLGQIDPNRISTIVAQKVTGLLSSDQIQGLAASKLIGQVVAAQVAAVNASAVTGQLTSAQIASIDAAKIAGFVQGNQIADGIIDATKIASGLVVPRAVTSLPAASGGPALVVLNGELYRNTGTAYTKVVLAVDVAGTLSDAQIQGLAASKLIGQVIAAQVASVNAGAITGQLSDAQLAGISAAKIAGTLTSDQIASLSAAKVAGTLSDAQLANISASKLIGSVVAGQIAGVNAAVIAGQLTSAQIASIDAAKVAGTLANAVIASANITGSITSAQIEGLVASKLVGQVVAAQIASVNAGVVTGQLTSAQIASIDAAKVAGTLSDAQLANIQASKLIGSVVATQIAGVNAAVIAGQLTSAQIASIDAAKVAGTLANAVIASANITGSITSAQIENLAATKLVGQVVAVQIASVNAGVVTGQLTSAQIASIDAAKVAGQITSGQIQSVGASQILGLLTDAQIQQLSATKIAGQIAGTQIAAGSITTDLLAANSITAGKLVLTDTSNLLLNGTFQSPATGAGSSEGWILDGAFVERELSGNGSDPGGLYHLHANNPGILVAGRSNMFAADPGSMYHVLCMCISSRPGGNTGLYIQWYDGNFNFLTNSLEPTSLTGVKNTWVRLEGQLGPAPVGTVYGRVHLFADTANAGEAYWGKVSARKAANATMIVDGSIIAGKLAVGSVTAANIVVGSLTGDRIAARTIQAGNIVAGSITAGEIAANTITAGQIQAGTITSALIQGGTITGEKIAANTINAGNIVAGSITTDLLAANSITASKLVLTDTSSLVLNGTFQNPVTKAASSEGWVLTGATVESEYSGNATDPGGLFRLHSTSPGTFIAGRSNVFAVDPGSNYYVSCMCFNARPTGNMGLYVEWYDGNLNSLSNSLEPTTLTNTKNTWVRLEGQLGPAPAGTVYGRLNLFADTASTGNAYWGKVSARKAANATMIVDGSIIAGKLAAGSVTATNIVVGSLTGDLLAANTITAAKIASRTIQAIQIAAASLTANEIAARTLTAANIVVGSLTGDLVAAATITGSNIQARTISAGNIIAGSITAGEIAANTITAAQIQAGTITSALIQGGTITGDKIAGNTISAGNIVAGSITTDLLAANSITASKLVLTDTSNLLLNGTFQNPVTKAGSSEGWILDGAFVERELSGNGSDPGGLYHLHANNPGTLVAGRSNVFAADPGSMYHVLCMCINSRPIGNIGIYIDWLDGNLNVLGNSLEATTFTGVKNIWVRLEGQLGPAPTGTVYGRVNLYANTASMGEAYWGKVSARKAANASMIVDGSIIAGKLAAGSVTAGTIQAGVVSATEIAGGSITGDRVAARTISAANIVTQSLTANEILAGTITGDRIAGRTISAGNLIAGSITAAEIAAQTLTSDQVSTNAIIARTIAAGAITVEKLAVGSGNNTLYNSDLLAGLGNITTGTSEAGLGYLVGQAVPAGYGNWALAGCDGVFVQVTSGAPSSGVIDIYWANPTAGGQSGKIPAKAGQRYEASVYTSAHRCSSFIIVSFWDANNSHLADGYGNVVANDTTSLRDTSAAPRSSVFFTPPAGTVYATVTLRMQLTGGTGPYAFFSGALFAPANPNQTTLSEWTPGTATIINGAGIQARTISATRIIAGSITAGEIAAGTITAGQIQAGTITAAQIQFGAITGDKIAANTISAGSIIAGSITGDKIAANSITASQIAVQTIRAENIVANTITTSQIAVNTIQAANIAASAIGADQIAAGAIQAGKIGAQVIVGDNVQARTLLAGNIAAYSLTAYEIAARTLTATQIQAGTITANEIQFATITGDKIAANTISAGNIIAGSITTDLLAANSITAGKLVLTDTSNLLLNGTFQNPVTKAGSSDGWILDGSFVEREYSGDGTAQGGLFRLHSNSPGTFIAARSNMFAVDVGSIYHVSGMCISSRPSGNTGLYIDWYDGNLSYISNSLESSTLTSTKNTWVRLEGQLGPAPAGTVYGRLNLFADTTSTGEAYWGKVSARKAANASMIVDGAITTQKILVGTLEGDRIRVGSLDARTIKAFTITGDLIAADTISTRLISARAIYGYQIGFGTLTGDLIAANTINAGSIIAGSITGDQIAAGTITVGKLVVSDTSNILANGTFQNLATNVATTEGWELFPNTVVETVGVGDPGGQCRLRGFETTRLVAQSKSFTVTPGDRFYVSLMVFNTRSGGNAGAYIAFRSENEGYVSDDYGAIQTYTSSKNNWTLVQGQTGDAPAGASRAKLILFTDQNGSGQTYFGKVSVRKAANATMIVDGSIIAGKIGADAVTSATIVAGAIGVREISAGAITTEKLAIGSGNNLIYNGDFLSGIIGTSWAASGSFNLTSGLVSGTDYSGNYRLPGMNSFRITGPDAIPAGQITDFYCQRPLADGSWSRRFPVVGGASYEFSAYLSQHRSTGCVLINWFDAYGNFVGSAPAGNTVTGTQDNLLNAATSARSGIITQAPSNASQAELTVRQTFTGETNPFQFICAVMFAQANAGQTVLSAFTPGSYTVIDGSSVRARSLYADRLVAGSITANEIGAGAITSEKITAGTLNGDRIQTGTLSATALSAGSVMSSNIVVGASFGNLSLDQLADMITRSVDYINAGVPRGQTTIQAGRVDIFGNGTLASWRNGGDNTKIDGGAIATNTIDANRIRIGSRGVDTLGISFSYDKVASTLFWTSGYVLYRDNNGNYQNESIPAGSIPWQGAWVSVFWKPGQGSFQSTTNYKTTDPDAVIMATYWGGTILNANYGKTIIDGGDIYANSLTANLVTTGEFITTSAQIRDAIVTNAKITNLDAAKITTGTLDAGRISAASITADKINIGGTNGNLLPNSDFLGGTYTVGSASNGSVVIDLAGQASQVLGGWAPVGMDGYAIHANPHGGSGIADIYQYNILADGSRTNRFPVEAGQRYEFSVAMSAHRCSGYLIATAYDTSANSLATQYGNGVVGVQSNGAIGSYARSGLLMTMPGNTAYVTVTYRQQDYTSSNDAWLLVSAVFMAKATANQTVLSSWSPGPFKGQITAANINAWIGSAAIGTAYIANAAITTAQIANAAITSAQITDAAITNAKIVNLSVDTIKIAGNAVSQSVGSAVPQGAGAPAYVDLNLRAGGRYEVLASLFLITGSSNWTPGATQLYISIDPDGSGKYGTVLAYAAVAINNGGTAAGTTIAYAFDNNAGSPVGAHRFSAWMNGTAGGNFGIVITVKELVK